MIPENSTQEWFSSLLQDEEAALGYFFKAYYPSLLRYVLPILNEDVAEAEDIISHCFMNLWEIRHTLKSPTHLKNTLYLAVRRRAISELRKRKTLTERQREWMSVRDKEEPENADRQDPELLRALILEEIYQRAEYLSPACREVFDLRYREGREVEEISRQLRISPQTVYNQLTRAITILRKLLKDKKFL